MAGIVEPRRMRHRKSSKVNAETGLAILLAAGIGAGVMYLFDPARGRRRRRLIADKVNSLAHHAGDAVGSTSRHLANRARGVAATARRPFRSHEDADVGDYAGTDDYAPYRSPSNGSALP